MPISMEAKGAPSAPVKEVKAKISIIMGKHGPTPDKAIFLIPLVVPNINTVHNVIQHIDKLCNDRWNSKVNHQSGYFTTA